MIAPTEFARTILETFDKSAIHVFRRWLALHPRVSKWIIAADFALRDPARPGDCFAFSLIPYDAWSHDLVADIKANLSRDLKDAKSLDAKATAWLRDPRRLHIAIPMNRDRLFYDNGPGSRPAVVVRESIKMTLEAMVRAERGADQLRRLKNLLSKAQANAFNVGLFTDLTLLALYLPVITLMLARERKPERVAWFCDRDSMISFGEGVVWDYALENLLGLSHDLGIDAEGVWPYIAAPDRSSGREVMWYDDYIRPADWLAGTLATWDRHTNQVPGEQIKYLQMVENVVADSENMIILPVILDGAGVRVTRLDVSRTLEPAGEGGPTRGNCGDDCPG